MGKQADSSILREWVYNDIKVMAALEQICFTDPWSEAMLEGEWNHPQTQYLICENSTGVLGYAGMWIILDEAHITNVAVHPDIRGCGIGKDLLLALMIFAKKHKANSMTLEVRERNEVAIALYEKNDFIVVGKRPNYYANCEDALIMWNHDISQTLLQQNAYIDLRIELFQFSQHVLAASDPF